MFGKRLVGQILGAAIVLAVGQGTAGAAEAAFAQVFLHVPDVRIGEVAFTAIGQVNNAYPDSAQFGYLPTITGLTNLFSSDAEDESTAYFTFYKEAKYTAVRPNGPLTIIEREGTTTIYYNAVPHATFADPDSFRDGQPIIVMGMKQQVNYDSFENAFTVVDSNDVKSAFAFVKDGKTYMLARKNGKFRWTMAGHSNDTPPPSGHFAAYVTKVQSQGD